MVAFPNRYSYFYMFKKTTEPFFRISTWFDIQIGIQIYIRASTCSERRQHNFPEYRPGSIFKSIFKSLFALLHGQKDDSTISPNIDLAPYSNRYSNRYSLYCMVRKTIAPFIEYRPGSVFNSIFKSVFALLQGQKDNSTISPNIDLALNSNRHSNLGSPFYMIRKTKSPFSRIPTWLNIQIDTQIGIRSTTWSEKRQHHFFEYRSGSIFKSIFKSVFALLHGQKRDSTIFSNIDLAPYSNRYQLNYMVRQTIAPFY